MRPIQVIGSFLILFATSVCGQQTSAPTPPSPADAGPARVKVYALGPGVTAPELLPLNFTPIPTEECKSMQDGKIGLSVLVDTAGQPRNIMFLHPLGTNLDKLALKIAAMDQFKPGSHDGVPVSVAVSLEVEIESCVEETEDSAGKKSLLLRMRSLPAQRIGPPAGPYPKTIDISQGAGVRDAGSSSAPVERVGQKVSAPVPLNSIEAEYTPDAKKARISGVCILSVIVDAYGMPQNPRIVKSLGPGLDQNALIAVNKYRFKPAMKNGTPVPVMIVVEVNYRLP